MLEPRNYVFLMSLILLSVVTYFGTRALIIHKAPKQVMSQIEERIAKVAGGWNKCFHNQTYGPRYNAAKRANPDSIISIMAYDLEKGPVRVSGLIWPRYWSLSLYQQNSDNFFVINDRQLDKPEFNFLLALESHDTQNFNGERVFVPTSKGIMLIRRFASVKSDMPEILANQNDLYCGPA